MACIIYAYSHELCTYIRMWISCYGQTVAHLKNHMQLLTIIVDIQFVMKQGAGAWQDMENALLTLRYRSVHVFKLMHNVIQPVVEIQ